MEKEQLTRLVKQSQDGDLEAMEQLLLYAHTPVSYQCRKMLKNNEDAEDMTQEILISIFEKLGSLQDPAAFNKWLHTITANRCLSKLANPHKEYQIAEDEEGNSALDALEDLDEQAMPDKALDNAETARMIGEVVDSLPDAQKMCTLMFYFDEMSVKDIAQALAVPENTVKSRLNYARKAIKEKVLDYEKQGIKLYGISPLPFLYYFLHKLMEESTDRKAGAIMVRKVMEEGGKAAAVAAAGTAGAAAAETAATAAGTAATAAAAGTGAAAGLTGLLSVKVIAGVAAAVAAVSIGLGTLVPIGHDEPVVPAPTAAVVEEYTEPTHTQPEQEPTVEEISDTHIHEYKITRDDKASCTQEGLVEYTCSCGDSYQVHTDKQNHRYLPDSDNPNHFVCSQCGAEYTQAPTQCEHTWMPVYEAPTCSQPGIRQGICSQCGEILPESVEQIPIDASAHQWGEWVTTAAPTDTDPGSQSRVCGLCGTAETQELPASGHTHQLQTAVSGSGTCVDPSIRVTTCTICGAETERVTLAAEHSNSVSETPATCVSAKLVTTTCTLCGIGSSEYQGSPDSSAHTGLSTSETPADCAHRPTRTTACSACGYSQTEEFGEVDPTAHRFVLSGHTPAACNRIASDEYSCLNCSYSYSENVGAMDPSKHDSFHTEGIDPTATTDGYSDTICDNCGAVIEHIVLPAGSAFYAAMKALLFR